jgi:class 3 adenylate cyclase
MAGDGALAAFDAPTPAVEYAQAFSTAVHELGLQVRAGVHAGEVERRGNDLAGIGVHIGARVAALAETDQILVTSTVRELAFGSRLTFIDRGEYELRGVNGSWHLYELNQSLKTT